MMETALIVVFAFALGSSVASFLNVVADRLPAGGSLVEPPSHCPIDGHVLKPYELFPVFSYLALRGKCRVCGARIPMRVPLVEFIGGAAFAAIGAWYGVTLDALLLAVTFSFLLVITIIDLEHRLVLNKVLLVAVPTALVSSALWSEELRSPIWDLGIRELSLVTDAMAAGLVGFALLLLLAVLSRGGMGGGDVKLAVAIGLWVGLRQLPMTLLVGVILGGIAAIFLILFRGSGRKSAMPFAPFLCGGTLIGLIWGETLGEWYLDLLTP
jgi:leader peptidase (prepilin peptidase) / N-methyltransferase